MMSVKEYAADVNLSVNKIIELLKKLNINVDSEDDMLDDDTIIMLDNDIANNNIDETLEEDIIENEEIEEEIEELTVNNKHNNKTKNKTNQISNSQKNDYLKKRKEMYKHKDKLKSNNVVLAADEIIYKEGMTVSELANDLNIPVGEIIKKLMTLGLIMNLNQSIDYDTAEVIVGEFSKKLKKEETTNEANFEELEIIDSEEELLPRPPVVTIMGHVDHGKTTLLDTIRQTNVVSGEAGGITQAIGAYQIKYQGSSITFIDTPGHAAFTEMRARGASITDIVIIIVAANDGVMPQTKEAIDHAKAAGVPIIVAINKIDLPGANPEKVKTEMAEAGLIPEEWGGDTMFVNISAKTGVGIDDLLERILLISEVEELKAISY